MTATISKTVITPTWTIGQIQESIARVHGIQFFTTMQILGKLGGEQAIQEFQSEMRKVKVAHYKTLGVKTPIELAKAIAEFETNVFGSKIEIWGDDKQAFLQYDSCAIWNAMQKAGNLTPKQEEEMGAKFESCMKSLAQEFGFKGETKFEGEACCVISFSK